MEKGPELSQTHCLNCSARVEGDFCHQCGQHVRDNSDRSIARLLSAFFSTVLFLDNRFFLSMRYLFQFPGRMTVEFLEGKRKKFISPVTLFLFFNLIYFFVKPLSDYSISLFDQIYAQPYSKWIKEWVDLKLQNGGLDERTYGITYQNMSDTISKSIMVINIPMIAAFVHLMAFKKRRFYYDSLIFAFHFFSLYIASWIMIDWAETFITFVVGQSGSIASDISFYLFVFFIPLFYAILSIKKFLDIKWHWAIPAGLGVIIAVNIANIFYRLIIFLLTFWAT